MPKITVEESSQMRALQREYGRAATTQKAREADAKIAEGVVMSILAKMDAFINDLADKYGVDPNTIAIDKETGEITTRKTPPPP